MKKVDWNVVDPYLINVEFDDKPEVFGDGIWAIMADVQIGDKTLLPYAKSLRNFLSRRIPKNGNLNGDFGFIVCSPGFKANPKVEYNYNLDYIHTAYVQDQFDKGAATKYLEEKINSIGKVKVDVFTQKIHEFLESEEWDYLGQMKA